MSVKFFAHNDQSQFAEILRSNCELRELFPLFMTRLELETDYDSVVLVCIPDNIRANIEDSPFMVEFDEVDQIISIHKRDEYSENYDLMEEWDFDEDSVEELVSFIADKVLDDY